MRDKFAEIYLDTIKEMTEGEILALREEVIEAFSRWLTHRDTNLI